MKKIWVNRADSFAQAEEFDTAYYLKMSGAQRLSAVQFLRGIYYKFKPAADNGNTKRLRRVIKVVQ